MFGRARRPEGTDGSDHVYRMLIENKYKRIAILKKYGKYLFYCHVGLIALLALWYLVPTFYGLSYPFNGIIFIVLELLTIIAYYFAATGTSKERMPLVKTYGVLLAALTAEHMLIRWWYHVKTPKPELFPQMLAKYVAVLTVSNTDVLRISLTVFEALLDCAVFFVLLSASFCCKSYVQEKRTPDIQQPESTSPERIKED